MPKPQQGKPIIYLLVILPILGLGGLSLMLGFMKAYAHIHGIRESAIPNLNGALITLPALFLWIPMSLVLANLVLFVVPPLRRIAERHTAQKWANIRRVQWALLKLTWWFAIVCVPLIALGFYL